MKTDSHIVFQLFTTVNTSLDFLKRAWEAGMKHIRDPVYDRALADAMTNDEELLLGGVPSTDTINRPNVHLMDLIRWLLLNRARPQ